MQRITANVYVEIGGPGIGCNYSIVVTSEGIVMIDTPSLPTKAVRWRDEIAPKGEVRYIINTEYHTDHISGNYFFPGTVISHEGVREMFSAALERVIPHDAMKLVPDSSLGLQGYIVHRFKKLEPESLSLAENYRLRPPTITFSERLNLYLGNHTFELIHLPGHTPYQVAVYVPQERVIFTGDNVINGTQPSFAHCCPIEWVESLTRIEAMDVALIVPGHGKVGDKQLIRETTKFIQECINAVRKAIDQGMSKEEAANTISFEEALPASHPGSEQQHRNVLRLYEMLSK